MPCYRPNIIVLDKSPERWGRNAKKIKFISANAKEFKGYEYYDQKVPEPELKWQDIVYQKIPCGQCVGCQEDYTKQWAVRCMLEASQWTENYFITLTYDDLHLPCESKITDKQTGELYEDDGSWQTGHLKEEDVQLFLKRLRKHWKDNYDFPKYNEELEEPEPGIRYFYCGEYGSTTERPHYHILLFNFPLINRTNKNDQPDPAKLKTLRINTNGSIYWDCKEIADIWGKGFVNISEVNWDTCAYTARYCVKKNKHKPREEYFINGQIPEYVRMSLKPGIGANLYTEAFYNNDEIVIKGHAQKIQSIKPPRFYDKIYDIDHHDEMNYLKAKRTYSTQNRIETKALTSSLTYGEQLKVEQKVKERAFKTLKRDKC